MDIKEDKDRTIGVCKPEYYIWSIKNFNKKWSLCIRRRTGMFESPTFYSGNNIKYEWCLEFTPNSRFRLKLLNFDKFKNTDINIKTSVSFINDEDYRKNIITFGELIVDESELIYSHALSTALAFKKKIFENTKFKILIGIIPSDYEFELNDTVNIKKIVNSAVILNDKYSKLSLPDPIKCMVLNDNRMRKRRLKNSIDDELKKKFIPMFIKIEKDKDKNINNKQQEYQKTEIINLLTPDKEKEEFIINNNNNNIDDDNNKISHIVGNLLTSSTVLSDDINDKNETINELFDIDSAIFEFDNSTTSNCIMNYNENIIIPEIHQVDQVTSTKNVFKKIETSYTSDDRLHMPFSDIILNIQGYKFESHKAILSASSTVLCDIIEKNKLKNEIIINNIKPQVAKQVLKYIYTQNVPSKLSEFSDELIDAAYKLNIIKLKELCENSLIDNMSSNTVVECVIIGNHYGANKLKNAAFKFFHNEVLTDPTILKSTSFNHITDNYPKLAVELLCKYVLNQNQNQN